MESNKNKPCMYLDQNALDQLRKKGTDAHFSALKYNFNFVYTNSTLREIHKAGINANNTEKISEFIMVLTKLDATYFQLPDTSYKFDARPYESHDKPLDVYIKFLEKDLVYDEFTRPMEKIGLAIYGGVKDYKAFGDEQINAMLNLQKFLSVNLEKLKIELSNSNDEKTRLLLTQYIDVYHEEMLSLDREIKNFKNNVRFVNENFKEANREQRAIINFRDTYRINIDNLKKIEGFDSLNRIFSYLDEVKPENIPSLKEMYSDIFNDEHRIFNRIFLAYDFLNLIGYHADEGLNKENKFLRSSLDRSHAALGCFCSILVTNDVKFIKKTKVIYEHFNIATKIYNIEVLDDKTSFGVVYDLESSII